MSPPVSTGFFSTLTDTARINKNIRAKELRVIGAQGENFGVLSLDEALQKALDVGLDLIEISPNATPPVAKIADYGKYLYEVSKKAKAARANAHSVETKSLQIKIGTGEHDLELKAKNASKWLKEGHRVKLELFLSGRSKYMPENFLKERLERILRLISEEYKVTDGPKKGPKGMSLILERGKK